MAPAARLAPRLLDALAHPRDRPLALRGRSGSGKTTGLRAAVRQAGREAVWCTARDVVDRMVQAIRDGSYETCSATFAGDDRPLCLEHLEDLRGKARTREALGYLLKRAAPRRPILLTLTTARGDGEILDWLRSFADVVSVGRPAARRRR